MYLSTIYVMINVLVQSLLYQNLHPYNHDIKKLKLKYGSSQSVSDNSGSGGSGGMVDSSLVLVI